MHTVDRSSRLRIGVLAGIAFAGLISLGARLIPGRELWLDESHSVYVARLPLGQLVAAVGGDVHPPLYFLLLHGWIIAAGDSLVALRVFSLLSTALAAVLIWRIARSQDGELAGLIALGLFVLSPAVLVYAVEIRMYALGLLTFCLTLFMVRQARTTLTMRDAALAGVAAALAIYTHYFALFAVAGLFGAWLLLDLRRATTRRSGIVACIVCALLVVPWMPTLLAQRATKQAQDVLTVTARTDSTALAFGGTQQERPSPLARVRLSAENVTSVIGVYPARSVALLVLLAVPFLVLGLAVLKRALAGDDWLLILLASAGATLAGPFILGLAERRYILLLAPLSALTIARAVSKFDRPRIRAVLRTAVTAIVCILAAGSLRVAGTQRSRPVADLIGVLKARAAPADRLLFSAPYGQILFDYHAQQAGLRLQESGFPEGTTDWWARQAFKGWGSPVPTFRDLDRAVGEERATAKRGGDVWLLLFETHYYDPHGLVRSRFASEGDVLFEWTSPDSTWTAVRIRMGP